MHFPVGYLDPHLIGLHGSLGPPEFITQTAYRSVQPFLQSSRQRPYVLCNELRVFSIDPLDPVLPRSMADQNS